MNKKMLLSLALTGTILFGGSQLAALAAAGETTPTEYNFHFYSTGADDYDKGSVHGRPKNNTSSVYMRTDRITNSHKIQAWTNA